MTVWFTADQHFGHANIISFCERPVSGLHQHTEMLVNAWCSRVRSGDRVYVLGDFLWKGDPDYILNKLPGELYLVAGNHDRRNLKRHSRWVWCRDLTHESINGQRIQMCHYPMMSWHKSVHGTWMLHGHCHGNPMPLHPRRLDVGVDTHPEYAPYSFEEVKNKIEEATELLEKTPSISECPNCGGPADQGFSREIPPVAYFCSKCSPAKS